MNNREVRTRPDGYRYCVNNDRENADDDDDEIDNPKKKMLGNQGQLVPYINTVLMSRLRKMGMLTCDETVDRPLGSRDSKEDV